MKISGNNPTRRMLSVISNRIRQAPLSHVRNDWICKLFINEVYYWVTRECPAGMTAREWYESIEQEAKKNDI